MTEFEQKVLAELASLRQMVESLRSDFTISQITYFENLPPAAVVGVDYVAYKFNVSESAVVRGRFDTDRIRRLRQKPLAFIKREVDQIFMEITKPSSEVAAEYRHKINQKIRGKK